jgi:hypothetical protein
MQQQNKNKHQPISHKTPHTHKNETNEIRTSRIARQTSITYICIPYSIWYIIYTSMWYIHIYMYILVDGIL